MGVGAWGLIVAVVAFAIGSIAIPWAFHRRTIAQARKTELQARKDLLTPAYDEILQAIARIRAVGSAVSNGDRVALHTQWDDDIALIEATGDGRYPVTTPSSAIQLGCMNVYAAAILVRSNVTEQSRFTEERFTQALRWATSTTNPSTSSLFRMINDEVNRAAQSPSRGSRLVQALDSLGSNLASARDAEIAGR